MWSAHHATKLWCDWWAWRTKAVERLIFKPTYPISNLPLKHFLSQSVIPRSSLTTLVNPCTTWVIENFWLKNVKMSKCPRLSNLITQVSQSTWPWYHLAKSMTSYSLAFLVLYPGRASSWLGSLGRIRRWRKTMENHENQWPPDILMQETNFQYLGLTVSLFPLEW